MCVSCVCAQACTSILCENSVRNMNQYHCKWYKPSLCVCVCVCVCVFVCVCVCPCVCAQACTSILCENSERNKNPKYLQVVQAQSVCVHVHVRVCVCHVCVHRRVQFMHMYTL